MGIKIVNEGALRVALQKYADRSTRELRRVVQNGANEIADTASEMAPFKSGDLEGSIEVRSERDGRRTQYVVETVGVPYAIYMHESFYELGPGSVQKAENSRFQVGRKYISRAIDYVMNDLNLMERARRAVRMK